LVENAPRWSHFKKFAQLLIRDQVLKKTATKMCILPKWLPTKPKEHSKCFMVSVLISFRKLNALETHWPQSNRQVLASPSKYSCSTLNLLFWWMNEIIHWFLSTLFDIFSHWSVLKQKEVHKVPMKESWRHLQKFEQVWTRIYRPFKHKQSQFDRLHI
jgi:hypothetical protein